jgi:hypothetical protein
VTTLGPSLVVVALLVAALSADAEPGHTILVGNDPECVVGCTLWAPPKAGGPAEQIMSRLFPGDCVTGLQGYNAKAAFLCNEIGCSPPAEKITPHPDQGCRRVRRVEP